jgi:WD40 repeat protein/tetratricopeptide (TPR) repeat protein
MAPEQARGAKDLSVAVDVYSLGAILYECLTGRPPFRGATPLDTVLQVLEKEAERPARLRPGVDRDLETVCLKCLDKDPARRYGSARDLADDLGRWQRGEPILARRYSAWERALKWTRRRPAVAALLAALLLASLVGLAGLAWGYRQAVAAGMAALERADEEERARLEADALNRKAERNLYDQHIALASQAWHAGNVPALLDLLDRCPARHRDWEWSYLRRLAHGDLQTFSLGEVQQVAFSPDGSMLALVVYGDEVRLVETLTGKLVHRLTTPWDISTALAFSPDGRRVAVGGLDVKSGPTKEASGGARLWDVATGKEVVTLEGKPGVDALAFHPDGKHLAGGCRGRPVTLWDTRSGRVARTLDGVSVVDLCFAPGGRHLAGVAPGRLYFWDLATGRTVFDPANVEGVFTRVAISPDGAVLVVSRVDYVIQFVDAKTGRAAQTLNGHTNEITGLLFSPDGRRLYSSGLDRTVRVWRVRDGSAQAVLRGHRAEVAALALSPDGRLLVSAGGKEMKFWDATREDSDARKLLSRDTLLLIKEEDEGARRPWVFSADGERFATITGGRLVTWRTRSGTEEASRPRRQARPTVNAWEFSPDGRTVALLVRTSGDQRRLVLIDVASGRPVRALEAPEVSWAFPAFSDDSQVLAASSGSGVKVWSVATGKLLHTLGGHSTTVQHLAISPDRRWLVSTSGESEPAKPGSGKEPVRLQVWDLTTGQARWKLSLKGSIYPQAMPSFSPDRRWLVAPRDARTVQVWDLQRGEAGRTISCPESVTCMTFAQGGTLALAWSNDVTLWDPASGERLHELRGHGQPVYWLAFSPDGRRLVSSIDLPTFTAVFEAAARRGEIIVWDVETGRQLLTLDGFGEVGFSPDGQMLVSMVSGVSLRLWDARPVRGDESALRLAGWREGARAWHEKRAQDGGRGAIHHLDCLLRLDPRNPAWYEQRGVRLDRAPALAVADLTRAIEIQPSAFRHALRGRAYRRLGRPAQAVADLTEAIRRGDDRAHTIWQRGGTSLELGEHGKALADLTFALALSPDMDAALADRAEAFAGLGRWREAEQDLARALAIADRDARRWSGRCLVLLADNRNQLARQLAVRLVWRFARSGRPEDLHEVLRVCACLPDTFPPEPLLRLALRLGQENALAELSPAQKPERLLLVGAGLYRAGVPALALPRLREAERLRGKQATGIEALFLAQCLDALGEKAAAQAALARAVKRLDAAQQDKRLDWRQRVAGQLLRKEAELRLGR